MIDNIIVGGSGAAGVQLGLIMSAPIQEGSFRCIRSRRVLATLFAAAFAGFLAPSSAESQCETLEDMTSGVWLPDPTREDPPGYKYCHMDLRQDCRGSGDGLYLKHRWQPLDCDIQQIETKERVEACLAGHSIAFVGDSLSRNMMVALECLLVTDDTEGGRDTSRGNWENTGYRVRPCYDPPRPAGDL